MLTKVFIYFYLCFESEILAFCENETAEIPNEKFRK